ncbi:MAG: radical SAM protein [Deltaproteobacteria bacterium]|nr:radical SAM protein [Deltaproteobacteria bacterium]
MYEQGVIRPPSEASSLLIRVTRNCPWNQCLFCPAYKGVKFSKRTVEEVKKDIDSMANELRDYPGVKTAFLQDADSLILPADDLIAILDHLKERFPKIDRITTYARARTLSHKSVDDLRRLKQAGLTRIHTGMESGSTRVLKMIKKGMTPEEVVTGGRHVMEAVIELSEYIMPGIGGRTMSEEHATETARLLNLIRPHFIRVRTFAMHPQSPMQKMVREGTFVPLTEDEIVAEIRLLVNHLDNMHSYFSCNDFSLNLLMQVDGFLDEKKEDMLKELDAFLSMTKRQRQVYTLLHYAGFGNYPLSVVQDQNVLDRVVPEIEKLEKSGGEHGFDEYIRMLKTYQLPQPQTDNWC